MTKCARAISKDAQEMTKNICEIIKYIGEIIKYVCEITGNTRKIAKYARQIVKEEALHMKKLIYLFIVGALFCFSAVEISALNLKIGASFPVEKLSSEKKPVDNTIVVFIPSLTYECDYAGMLTQSFYYYFDQKMAFEGLKKNPSTQIFLIVADQPDAGRSTQNLFGGMRIVFDEEGKVFSDFGVKNPVDKNADATVVLLDAQQTIRHIDEHYRAQGEHLKPLENKLRQLNGIAVKVKASSQKPLKVGDLAPNFPVGENQTLADWRGQVVLVSFYPAAFSGTLPKNIPAGEFQVATKEELSMSCVFQIDGLDITNLGQTKRIVISSSTRSLLQKWQELLGTQNIEYVNDPDYSISSKYLSYNAKGYNNRVSVIVDQKGKIAYIDKDFDFNDEAILNDKINELLNSENR